VTNEVTSAANAAPMTNAIASVIRFPRKMKSLKSRRMPDIAPLSRSDYEDRKPRRRPFAYLRVRQAHATRKEAFTCVPSPSSGSPRRPLAPGRRFGAPPRRIGGRRPQRPLEEDRPRSRHHDRKRSHALSVPRRPRHDERVLRPVRDVLAAAPDDRQADRIGP